MSVLSAPKLDQPKDNVALALAGAAQGPQAIHGGRPSTQTCHSPLALSFAFIGRLRSGGVAPIAS